MNIENNKKEVANFSRNPHGVTLKRGKFKVTDIDERNIEVTSMNGDVIRVNKDNWHSIIRMETSGNEHYYCQLCDYYEPIEELEKHIGGSHHTDLIESPVPDKHCLRQNYLNEIFCTICQETVFKESFSETKQLELDDHISSVDHQDLLKQALVFCNDITTKDQTGKPNVAEENVEGTDNNKRQQNSNKITNEADNASETKVSTDREIEVKERVKISRNPEVVTSKGQYKVIDIDEDHVDVTALIADILRVTKDSWHGIMHGEINQRLLAMYSANGNLGTKNQTKNNMPQEDKVISVPDSIVTKCDVCNVNVDNLCYSDHINGKRHRKNVSKHAIASEDIEIVNKTVEIAKKDKKTTKKALDVAKQDSKLAKTSLGTNTIRMVNKINTVQGNLKKLEGKYDTLVDNSKDHIEFRAHKGKDFCKICNVKVKIANSESLNEHYKEKSHVENIEVYFKNNNISKLNSYHYHCNVCKKTVAKSGINSHCESAEHKKAKGVNFCLICNVEVHPNNMNLHLKGKAHQLCAVKLGRK